MVSLYIQEQSKTMQDKKSYQIHVSLAMLVCVCKWVYISREYAD